MTPREVISTCCLVKSNVPLGFSRDRIVSYYPQKGRGGGGGRASKEKKKKKKRKERKKVLIRDLLLKGFERA